MYLPSIQIILIEIVSGIILTTARTLGILFFIISLLLLIYPKMFVKLNKLVNKTIFTDAYLFSSPKWSGYAFIVFGFVMMIIAIFQTFNTAENFSSSFWIIMLFCYYIFAALLTIVCGVIFLVNPALLIRISSFRSKFSIQEETFLLHPRILGSAVFLISVYLLYMF